MMETDTLRLDSATVSALKADGRYDYDRELVGDSQNLLEWISEQLSRWLRDKLGMVVDSDVTYYVLVTAGLLLIGLLIWMVWRRRHAIVGSAAETVPLDYTVEEDTIYGVDFAADIEQMVRQGRWRQCVRLVYLQTLKELSDAGRVDWQPSKTPAQYVSEVHDDAFTSMSSHFIRVRYGNFPADEQLFHLMTDLQEQVRSGGAPQP